MQWIWDLSIHLFCGTFGNLYPPTKLILILIARARSWSLVLIPPSMEPNTRQFLFKQQHYHFPGLLDTPNENEICTDAARNYCVVAEHFEMLFSVVQNISVAARVFKPAIMQRYICHFISLPIYTYLCLNIFKRIPTYIEYLVHRF